MERERESLHCTALGWLLGQPDFFRKLEIYLNSRCGRIEHKCSSIISFIDILMYIYCDIISRNRELLKLIAIDIDLPGRPVCNKSFCKN